MSAVTRLLDAVVTGDRRAADELLPLVYAELCRLAAVRMAGEKPGQTLDATALVHGAYLRLVGGERPDRWDCGGHFFAAEAKRRTLVDAVRRQGGPAAVLRRPRARGRRPGARRQRLPRPAEVDLRPRLAPQVTRPG